MLFGTPLVDPDAVTVAMRFIADNLPNATAEKALPELRIEPTDGGPAFSIGSGTIGSGEPSGTLRATGFDLLRSFSGRRTAEQIRALGWEGDADVWLAAFTFGPFRVPAETVEPGPSSIPGG